MRIVQNRAQEQKRAEGKCFVFRCESLARSKHHKFCHKHARQYQKETNPTRYWYDILRQRAKKRGVAFSLTIEEFRDFCAGTHYLELKGRNAGSVSLDRIDNRKGYEAGNLQVLDVVSNTRKQAIDRMLYEKYGENPITKLDREAQDKVDEFYRNAKYWEQYEGEPKIKETNPNTECPF